MNEIVTYYSSHKSNFTQPVDLEKVLCDFRSGRFSSEISKLRELLAQQDEQSYKEAKKKLSAVAFCGEFQGGHAKNNLVRYNNLLVFDIDHLSEEEMRKADSAMSSDNHILAFWVSPSGRGYKGLIRVNFQNTGNGNDLDYYYKKAFKLVTEYFYIQFRIELDKNCSDYSRICYVCWDPNLYYNNNAQSFDVDCLQASKEKKKTKSVVSSIYKPGENIYRIVNVAGKNSQHNRNLVSSILKFLRKRNLSITRTYDDWLHVGFALANTFNFDLAVKYYTAFSKLDADIYNEKECIEKLRECFINGRGDVTLGTIIEMARSKGFKGSSKDI